MKVFLTIALTAITLLPPAAHSADRWPDAFARRGYKLGMNLSEFRQREFPDRGNFSDARPVCSNDTDQDPSAYVQVYSEDYRAAGVIACSFFSKKTVYGDGQWHEIGPSIADRTFPTTFYFIPEHPGEKAILFDISTSGSTQVFDLILPVLNEGYGQGKHRTEAVQNGLGNTFQNDIYEWSKGASTVTFSRYDYSMDKFSLEYTLDEMLAKISEIGKKSISDQAKKL